MHPIGAIAMSMNPDTLAKVQAIVAQLDEQLQESKEHNRRRAARVTARFGLKVILISGDNHVPLDVFTRNISASGISFLSRRLFHEDEHVALALRIPGRGGKLIHARTTFARYLREGVHEVGVEFLECIADPAGTAEVPRAWVIAAAAARHEAPTPREPAPKRSPAGAGTAAITGPASPPVKAAEAPAEAVAAQR